MSDFVNEFWNWYVILIVLASVIGCAVLLFVQSQSPATAGKTMGHVWDETLEEYNNPMPKWWSWLFYITVVFALGYLVLYPGLGRFQGYFGWSAVGQHQKEVDKAEQEMKPVFDKYLKTDLKALAADKDAMETGKRLFQTYCVQCHGSDGKGSKGFPNLTDHDWLYGGEPEQVLASISDGRNGMMPPYGGNPDGVGGEAGAKEIAQYVRSLSGIAGDSVLVAKGKDKFAAVCAGCHGPDGKGMAALGAPNLTDKIWLYGGSEATIVETITKGRQNVMPAWRERLGEGKVHLLAAYVLSLSAGGDKK